MSISWWTDSTRPGYRETCRWLAPRRRVLAQGVAEAQAQSLPATFAVVDRVGNVLAVFAMNGANPRLQVPRGPNTTGTPNTPPGNPPRY